MVAGVVLRIVLLRGPTGAVHADEAVVGLMARNILHRHRFTTFYWGQNYGGTLSAIAMAAVFALFGDSIGTMRAVPLAESAITAVLVWRLGRRTISEPGATFAGLAFWVWPTNYVWLSTKEWGFYWSAMIIGLSFLLVVLDLVEHPRSTRRWLLLGLLAGLGWWQNPQILYLFVPGVVYLAFRLRAQIARIWIAVPTAIAGALPWLAWNVRNDWDALAPKSHEFDKGYVGNIEVLVRHGVPVALGLNAIERWLVPVVFPILYVVLIIAGAVGVALRPNKPWILIFVVALMPLLWGAYPNTGVIGEGRYVIFLLPALILLLMHAARHPVVQVALLLGALAVSIDGVHRISCCTEPRAPDVYMPRHVQPLLDALHAHDVTRFYGDYFIVYRVVFESHENIVGSPRIFKRWPPYEAAVAADPHPAAVFVAASRLGPRFERGLVALGIGFDKYRAGDFVVYQPTQRVDFEHVLRAGTH